MDVQSTARFDSAAGCLCGNLREELRKISASAKSIAQEIRLRAGFPIALTCHGQTWFVGDTGELHNLPQKGYIISRKDIADSIVTMCNHSVHTHQEEIKQGFVSLVFGHRAGICGTAVLEKGQVAAVRDATSINLRIAREIKGAADELMDKVYGKRLCGVLIAGPPSSGKTTILRDLARQLSWGKGGRLYRVAVVDERCEIAAVYEGNIQNQLGPCCDVLSGYPKGKGILTAVRCLNPQVIVCDEIGGGEEVESILDGLNCGVKVIATAHADSVGELLRRRQIRRLLEHGAFERVVLLGGGEAPGKIQDILEVGEMVDQVGGNDPHRAMLIDDGRIHGIRVIEKSFRD